MQRGPFSKEGTRKGRPTNGAPSENKVLKFREREGYRDSLGSRDDDHMHDII
jgi:hypothetical protein